MSRRSRGQLFLNRFEALNRRADYLATLLVQDPKHHYNRIELAGLEWAIELIQENVPLAYELIIQGHPEEEFTIDKRETPTAHLNRLARAYSQIPKWRMMKRYRAAQRFMKIRGIYEQ